MSKKITIRRNYSEYRFPTPETVPAGRYWTRIEDIRESITSAGRTAIDVDYLFEEDSEEETLFHVRQRYADGSPAQDAFYDAMVNAGVPEGADITEAIGVTEYIDFSYSGDFGIIKKRRPVEPESAY